MSVTIQKILTIDDLMAMGADFHGEMVKGKVIEMAPASWGHGATGANALLMISYFVKERKLGLVLTAETGFILSRNPDTVRAPDVAFIAQARVPQTSDRTGFFNGPPDLAVEIISPGETQPDIMEKIDDYLKAGTHLIWIINSKQQTISIFEPNKQPVVLRSADTITGGHVLPGFEIPVSKFFE